MQVEEYVSKNLKGLPPHIHKWLKDNNDNPPAGVCLSDYKKSANCLIWLSNPPEKDLELFTHEVAHAAYRIMTHWSIAIDEETQEVLAMIIGFIVKNTLYSKNKR